MEQHERPDIRDKLELLRLDRGFLVNPFMPVAWTLATVVQLVGTVIVLGRLHPLLMLLPVAGIPSWVLGPRVEARREARYVEQAEQARGHLHLIEPRTTAAA